jgi:hypothetical protein
MRRRLALAALASAGWIHSGCSGPEKPAPSAKVAAKPAEPPRITQLYTTTPTLARGEKGLLCYGVENAKRVWLSPPRQELSAALSRCVEAAPPATTTYTLTAEGADGESVTRELTITLGPPKPPPVRIVEVTVNALQVRRGDVVSICYHVEHATGVRIDPLEYRAGSDAKGCATDQPRQTTTYTVTAKGAGSEDHENVTVKVQ